MTLVLVGPVERPDVDVLVAPFAQELTDRVIRQPFEDGTVVVGRRVLRGDEVIEVIQVQRRRQRQRGLDVVRVTVGHDLEAPLAKPIEEGPIVDLVLQLEGARRAVSIEHEVPDVAARAGAPADRCLRGRAPSEAGDLARDDRDEGEHDQQGRHDVERARHARQMGIAQADRGDRDDDQEDGPADLLEARLDAERTQHAGQVAVQEQRGRQGGDAEGRPTGVSQDGCRDQQQRERRPDDDDERHDQVRRLELAEVLPVQEQDRVRGQQHRMQWQRPATPRGAKPPGEPRGRAVGGARVGQ